MTLHNYDDNAEKTHKATLLSANNMNNNYEVTNNMNNNNELTNNRNNNNEVTTPNNNDDDGKVEDRLIVRCNSIRSRSVMTMLNILELEDKLMIFDTHTFYMYYYSLCISFSLVLTPALCN